MLRWACSSTWPNFRLRACLLGCLCCWVGPWAEAKVQSGVVKVGSVRGYARNRWKYLGKFTFGLGESTFKVKIQATKSKKKAPEDVTLTVEAYQDDNWTLAQAIDHPCDRGLHASMVADMQLLKSQEWSPWREGMVHERSRPHIWSFYLSDCHSNAPNQSIKVQYELQTLQPDGSQLSIEQAWMPHANLVTLLGFSLFFWRFVVRCRSFYRTDGSFHPVVWTLGVIVCLLYIAEAFRTLHFFVYRSNGRGLIAIEVVSEILFVIGQMTQTSLFILIGLGYTLLQSKLGDLDIVLPVASIVGMIHMMVVLIAKFADDRPDKLYEHEGAVGWVVLFLQCGLYIWFVVSIRWTRTDGGPRLEPFLGHFWVAGTLYLLAYPALLLLVPLVPPHLRPPVMSTGLTVFQILSNVYLTRLFLERNSTYFKVSTLNSSLLPGGARVGVDKEE